MNHTRRFIFAGALLLAIVQFGPLLFSNNESASANDHNVHIKTLTPSQLHEWTRQEGSTKLLFIFASWCPHCQKQLPIIERIDQEYTGKLSTISLSIDKDPQALARYLARASSGATAHMPEHYYNDMRRWLATLDSDFTGAIPHIILFDKQGALLDEVTGHVPYPALKSALEKLL